MNKAKGECGVYKGCEYKWISPQFEFDGTNNWNIYNNTLPLSELSDEQRGLLFNYHCNGGQLQNSQHGGSEIDVFYDTDSWSVWSLNTIYRAKQKTERELFIDEWSSKITTNEYNGGNVRLLVGQMFDDVNGIK